MKTILGAVAVFVLLAVGVALGFYIQECVQCAVTQPFEKALKVLK